VLLKDLTLLTGLFHQVTAIVNTPIWVTGAKALVLSITMNFGKHSTGPWMPQLLLNHQHLMDGLHTNKLVTATSIPNSPTPMVFSLMEDHVFSIALPRDLTSPTGLSHLEIATASTTQWETGVTISVP